MKPKIEKYKLNLTIECEEEFMALILHTMVGTLNSLADKKYCPNIETIRGYLTNAKKDKINIKEFFNDKIT
jgi:hypothetical protein